MAFALTLQSRTIVADLADPAPLCAPQAHGDPSPATSGERVLGRVGDQLNDDQAQLLARLLGQRARVGPEVAVQAARGEVRDSQFFA